MTAAPTDPAAPTHPEITCFTLGPFETNCYVISFPGSRSCWIVDASFEPEPLIEHVRRQHLAPETIVLTHAHVDHIAGLGDVRRAFPGTPVLIHEAERAWLESPELNLSVFLGAPVSEAAPDRLLRDGEKLSIAGQTWRVLHVPGHSPGGIALVHDTSHTCIAGDALFAGSVGRTDFPGSDPRVLARSIRERLYSLPPETRILPGHGPATTIGRERLSNPFVRT